MTDNPDSMEKQVKDLLRLNSRLSDKVSQLKLDNKRLARKAIAHEEALKQVTTPSERRMLVSDAYAEIKFGRVEND